MMIKKRIIFLLFLITILMISVVSASSNTTDTVSSNLADKPQKHTISPKSKTRSTNINNINIIKIQSKNNKNKQINKEYKLGTTNITNTGTFDELSTDINNVKKGGILNLQKNYKYRNGSQEGITINKSITINGNDYTLNGNKQSRIFNVTNGAHVILKNIKFINGNTTNSGGAIIVNDDSKITIKNCIFTRNTSPASYVNSDEGDYIDGGEGGAICINAEHSNVTATIINCTFNYNVALSGGAIHVKFNSNVTIINSIFTRNTAKDYHAGEGGAISTWGDNSNLNIINSKFTYNSAPKGSSGAIEIGYNSKVVINKSIFSNNKAQFDGAIRACGDAKLIITDSAFNHNTARSSSGAIGTTNSAILNVINSNFTENTADWFGGAISTEGKKSIISNSRFIQNSAWRGGDIYINNGNTVDIHKCTLKSVYRKTGKANLIDCIFTPIKIIAPSITTEYNKNKYLIITLKDHKGKLLSGFEVCVNLNGVKTLTTNNKGQIKVSTKGLKPKKYTAKISLAGKNKNLGPIKKVKVIVKKTKKMKK